MRFNALLAVSGFLVSASLFAAPAKFTKSSGVVEWKGVKTTGESHNGTVDLKEGELDLTAKKGQFIIDMKTIKVTDDTPENKKPDLIGHLSNKDFFEVSKNPEAKIVIKDIAKDPAGADKYTVTADVTISGITHEEKLPATIVEKDKKVSIDSTFPIDRTKYGQTYKAKKSIVDKAKQVGTAALIEDNFTLTIKLTSV